MTTVTHLRPRIGPRRPVLAVCAACAAACLTACSTPFVVHEASPTVGVWSALGATGHPIVDAAGAQADRIALVWGGLTSGNGGREPTDTGMILVVGEEHLHFEAAPDGPLSPRSGHLAVAVGSSILVWGGRDARGDALRDGALFDVDSRTWEKVKKAPRTLENAHAHATNSTVYIGGTTPSGELTVYEYDVADDDWSTVTSTTAPALDWTVDRFGAVVVASPDMEQRETVVQFYGEPDEGQQQRVTVPWGSDDVEAVSLTPSARGIALAGTAGDHTTISEISRQGREHRVKKLPASVFSAPASGTDPHRTLVRVDDMWIRFGQDTVAAFDLQRFTIATTWQQPACLTRGTWVHMNSHVFARYGGDFCDPTRRGQPSILDRIDLF